MEDKSLPKFCHICGMKYDGIETVCKHCKTVRRQITAKAENVNQGLSPIPVCVTNREAKTRTRPTSFLIFPPSERGKRKNAWIDTFITAFCALLNWKEEQISTIQKNDKFYLHRIHELESIHIITLAKEELGINITIPESMFKQILTLQMAEITKIIQKVNAELKPPENDQSNRPSRIKTIGQQLRLFGAVPFIKNKRTVLIVVNSPSVVNFIKKENLIAIPIVPEISVNGRAFLDHLKHSLKLRIQHLLASGCPKSELYLQLDQIAAMLGDGLGQFIEEVAEQIPDEKTKSDFRQFIKVADHYRLVPPQDGSIKIPTAVSVELIESLQAEKEKREMELGRDLTPLEIAIMIYEVLHARLTYDFAKFARIKKHTDTDPYREGLEVLRDSKGVCGETAYVFTGACRFFGLRSAWVDVPKLTHALSVVILDTGEEVFFDLAYSDYGDNLLRKFAKEGVHRADLHILNDLQTLKDFNSIRPDPLIKIFEDEFVT